MLAFNEEAANLCAAWLSREGSGKTNGKILGSAWCEAKHTLRS